MSWEATAWAKKTRGHKNHAEARVLMVLADYVKAGTNEAWPSQEALAKDCEMSERQVRRYLISLANRELLRVGRKGNQHQPTLYHLAFSEPDKAMSGAPKVNRTLDGRCSTSEPDIIVSGSQTTHTDDMEVNRTSGASEPDKAMSYEPTLRAAKKNRKNTANAPTQEFQDGLVEEYADRLGGTAHVRDEIEHALNHTASQKAIDKRKYLQVWLRRAVEFRQQRIVTNGHGPPRRTSINDEEKWLREAAKYNHD